MATLFAYDYSGSTGFSKIYHELSQLLYTSEISKPGNSVTILLWDSNAEVSDAATLAEINKTLDGRGGTQPVAVARYIKNNNFHGRLVFLSDGQVSTTDVDETTKVLGIDWAFESVDVHLVNTGGTVNLSVSCPFTRCSSHRITEYSESNRSPSAPSVIVSSEDLGAVAMVKTIATVDEYTALSEQLEKVVQARTMGTMGDPSLRDEILAMKKRITEAVAKASAKDPSLALATESMATAVREGDAEEAVRLAGIVTSAYYATTLNGGWSGSISRLVAMCEGALRSTFDLSGANAAIHGDRARRAEEAEEASVEEIPLAEEGGAAPVFECPITLCDETDVVLLVTEPDGGDESSTAEGGDSHSLRHKPLLAGLDKSIVNAIADCPLNALNYPEVVDGIRAHLDHPISLKAAQEAARAGTPITRSPFTRRRVLGVIALGCSEEHITCANGTIARLVAGGKRLGNSDLWFAVVWRVIASGMVPHLHAASPPSPSLSLSHPSEEAEQQQAASALAPIASAAPTPIADLFKAQLVWRCEHHSSFMSLTGQPELPTTRVPLGIAAWYVFASCALSLNGREEPIRAHIAHLAALEAVVEACGYDRAIPPGVRPHVRRLRVGLGMLAMAKKDRRRLASIVKGLYQNVIAVNEGGVSHAVAERELVQPFVPVGGRATEESLALVLAALPKEWAPPHTTPMELFALSTLVDPSLSAGDVTVPFDFEPFAEAQWAALATPVTEWAHDLLAAKEGAPRPVAEVAICPATCRPFFMCAKKERASSTPPATTEKEGGAPPAPALVPWTVAFEDHYGFQSSEAVSLTRRFGDFVQQYRHYPTSDELLVFAYTRVVKSATKKSTLPSKIADHVSRIMAAFEPIKAAIEPDEFVERYSKSLLCRNLAELEKK